MMATGRPLDVAVQGAGWIAVETPDGNEAYTRAGNLQVNANGQLLYLGRGRDRLDVRSAEAGAPFRLLLIGGAPFGEDVLMWWNFVGRSREELARAVSEWNAGAARFGEVRGYPGNRLPAPLPPWGSDGA